MAPKRQNEAERPAQRTGKAPSAGRAQRTGTAPRAGRAQRTGTAPRAERAQRTGTAPRAERAQRTGTAPRAERAPRDVDPPHASAAPRERRSLSHVGGRVRVRGDREAGDVLAAALDVASALDNEADTQAHVHGFHTYPARLHPETAARLITPLSRPREAVLDPFCGSGTVLVEARLAGRFAAGMDANPLAVRLARLKAQTTTHEEREMLVRWAHNIAETADSRREARAGASRRYPEADVAMFDPHVLLELDGLRVGLLGFTPRNEEEAWAKDALWLVFSAILTKVSRRVSDTTQATAPRRLFAGYVAQLFVRKADELADRLAEIAPYLEGAPGLWVEEGDARELSGIEDGAVSLTVTSPPYAGVYDYVAHHEARLRWLGLTERSFQEREIGARSRLSEADPATAHKAWAEELGSVLAALRRVTKTRGLVVLLMADSVIGGEPSYADHLIETLAPRVGFDFIAVASQSRPHFHAPTKHAFRERPRSEHAVLLSCAPFEASGANSADESADEGANEGAERALHEPSKHAQDGGASRRLKRLKTSRRPPR